MAGLLVLGASGLIGRAVMAEARRVGVSPVMGVGRRDSQIHGADAWYTLNLSNADASSVSELLASVGPSAIINCVGRVAGDRPSLIGANVMTVGVLLDAMANSRHMSRLVHVGSAAEYSPTAPGVTTGEGDPTEPLMPYGVTKAAATRLVEGAILDRNVDAVVARVFNPLGADMPDGSMPGRAARILRDAARVGRHSVSMGPLGTFRDFIDTRDIAAALLRLTEIEHPPHRIFNVASGVGTKARDVVRLIAAEVGFDGRVIETAPSSPRSGDVVWQQADIGRLTAVGWHARHDLHASVAALIASLDPPNRAAASREWTDS